MNPNITENVVPLLSGFKNIHLIEPLEYEPFYISASIQLSCAHR